MIHIVISVVEYEGYGDKKHRTGRSCKKWFQWPIIPRVGEFLFLAEKKTCGGDVESVSHFMTRNPPQVLINVDLTNYPIQTLIEEGWERTGTKIYRHKPRMPEESLKYNEESPVPLDESVDILPVPNRVCRILKEAGIVTIGQLVDMTEKDVFKTPYLKWRSARQIKSALSAVGRSLKQAEG